MRRARICHPRRAPTERRRHHTARTTEFLMRSSRCLLLAGTFVLALAPSLHAQRAGPDTSLINRRWQTERELQSIAVVERKFMMSMRDGVRLATDIYRPKDSPGRVPTIFSKTPYNF